jgi:hypothetical protein
MGGSPLIMKLDISPKARMYVLLGGIAACILFTCIGVITPMKLFVLYCFLGVYLIASNKRNVRFAGFFLSLLGSLSWCIYGWYINDTNVIFQFVGYSILNVVGLKNNMKDDLSEKK